MYYPHSSLYLLLSYLRVNLSYFLQRISREDAQTGCVEQGRDQSSNGFSSISNCLSVFQTILFDFNFTSCLFPEDLRLPIPEPLQILQSTLGFFLAPSTAALILSCLEVLFFRLYHSSSFQKFAAVVSFLCLCGFVSFKKFFSDVLVQF